VQSKNKTKTKTVLAANTSLKIPSNVAENEQIVMEEEDTSPRATEKETDTRKQRNSVGRPGEDNEVLEGTSKPRKKRKKDKSRNVAVTESSPYPIPSASSNLGAESERMDESQTPLTSQVDGKKVECLPRHNATLSYSLAQLRYPFPARR
jgi:hypothetical protein